jgi:hypothetical protein
VRFIYLRCVLRRNCAELFLNARNQVEDNDVDTHSSHDWFGSGLPPEETEVLAVQSTASHHFPGCRIVPGLPECTKLIVCDGYKVQEDPKHKNYNRVGVVKPEQVERYHTYMDNVCRVQPGRLLFALPGVLTHQRKLCHALHTTFA